MEAHRRRSTDHSETDVAGIESPDDGTGSAESDRADRQGPGYPQHRQHGHGGSDCRLPEAERVGEDRQGAGRGTRTERRQTASWRRSLAKQPSSLASRSVGLIRPATGYGGTRSPYEKKQALDQLEHPSAARGGGDDCKESRSALSLTGGVDP